MRFYSDDNPPDQGIAKKIYDALKSQIFIVHDLHYNPNCWGKGKEMGWGTWACDISGHGFKGECWCGWQDGRAYLQGTSAPYIALWISPQATTDAAQEEG